MDELMKSRKTFQLQLSKKCLVSPEPKKEGTPLKGKSDLNQNDVNIKSTCLNIFLHFSQFAKEENDFILSYSNLKKILRTVNLLNTNLIKSYSFINTHDADVILKKVSPNSQKLNSTQFMNFIVQLSNRIDKDGFEQNPKVCVWKIIKRFFEPLATHIHEQNNISESETAEMTQSISSLAQIKNNISITEFDDNILLILNSIYNAVLYLYKSYFARENNSSRTDQIKSESLNDLIEFCKKFELSPYFVSVEKIAVYYYFILNCEIDEITKHGLIYESNKEKGKLFTLSKFAAFLTHIALLTYDKFLKQLESNIQVHEEGTKNSKTFNYKDISNAEKVILFLDKLETSKGLELTEKKTCKSFHGNLLPSKEIITAINPLVLNVFNNDHKYNLKFKQEMKSLNSSPEDEIHYKTLLSTKNAEIIDRYEKNMDILRDIFESYTVIGDKFNFHQMTISGFLRFLKDFGLITTNINPSNARMNRFPIHSEKKVLTKSMSNYPIRGLSQNIKRNLSSSHIQHSKNENIPGQTPIKEIFANNNQNQFTEGDVTIVFQELCGVKNFDFSSKIKRQFDKNVGMSANIEDLHKNGGFLISRKSAMQASKVIVAHKMNFQIFLKSFENIAMKLYSEMTGDEAMIALFDKDLAPYIRQWSETTRNGIMEMLNLIRKGEVSRLLEDLQVLLYPFFTNYADSQGLMPFEKFFELYKDFSIFPDITNLIQLKTIFLILSDFLKSQIRTDGGLCESYPKVRSKDFKPLKSVKSGESKVTNCSTILKNEFINYDLFAESLAISSFYTKIHDEANDIEKLILLVEKMCQSFATNVNISQKMNNKTLSSCKDANLIINAIRKKYENYFEQKNIPKEILRSSKCFDYLFSTNANE